MIFSQSDFKDSKTGELCNPAIAHEIANLLYRQRMRVATILFGALEGGEWRFKEKKEKHHTHKIWMVEIERLGASEK